MKEHFALKKCPDIFHLTQKKMAENDSLLKSSIYIFFLLAQFFEHP